MLLIVLSRGKFASTNQKHYPDLGDDMSSVRNFCSRSLDVISQGRFFQVKVFVVYLGSFGLSGKDC